MCDLEAIGAPSMFRLIRSAAALARMLPTFDLSFEENAARRKWNLVCATVIVYYESLKRELKTKTIYGCRCDERLEN